MQLEPSETIKLSEPKQDVKLLGGRNVNDVSRDMGNFYEVQEVFSKTKTPESIQIKEIAEMQKTAIDSNIQKILKSQGLINERITDPTKGWRGSKPFKFGSMEQEIEIYRERPSIKKISDDAKLIEDNNK